MTGSPKTRTAIAITLLLVGIVSCGAPVDDRAATPAEAPRPEDGAGDTQDAPPRVDLRRATAPVTGDAGGTASFPLIGSLPAMVNPIAAADGVEQALQRLWHAAPLRRAPLDGRWEAWLARGFRFTDAGLTIQLRPGLTWSDGRPLTAPAWVRSVSDYYLDPAMAGPWREVLAPSGYTIRWTAPDDVTLDLTIDPVPANAREILLRAASVPPLPLHLIDPILERLGPRAVTDAGTLAPGDPRGAPDPLPARLWAFSGPFVPVPDADGRLRLERNDSYGLTDAAGGVLPYLDALELVPAGSAEAALELFLAGELSLAEVPPGMDSAGRLFDIEDLGDRLEAAGIEASVVVGTSAPERLLYLGADGSVPEGPAGPDGGAPPVLVVPEGVPILLGIAPLVLPVGYEIEAVGPGEYLQRLYRPESRAAVLVLLNAPDPPRPLEVPETGESVTDLSTLLVPRLLAVRGLENIVPDRSSRPLWTGAADRVFWRGGTTR